MFCGKNLVSTTILGSLAFMLTGTAAWANADLDTKELLNLSLEQLSNIEVTSVSKKSEKASEAAAAIYVITPDDIRRSGMTSVPELLRMVPGLDVAQSGAHQWSISSRGFNDQFANKLLVLIDGRSVYTPMFSGVFWDIQDVQLQDVERIEVIRGPGATLWGANAVNGVINIITKSAKDTQGGYASETVGNQDRSLTNLRYGAKLGENAFARVYAKYDERDEFRTLTETGANDAWNKSQGGFRSDWKAGESHSFTLQGDAYRARENYTLTLPLPTPAVALFNTRETDRGGNVLGRWDNKINKDSDLTLQMYADDASRGNMVNFVDVRTFDVDIQHVWTALHGQEIVWGGGYRFVKSNVDADSWVVFNPASQTDNVLSAFVQDKITLVPDKWFLTLGSKFEHNNFTGFEYQPSARLSWLIDSKQTAWASASRAVRTPDIASRDVQVILSPLAASTFLARLGQNSVDSEELIAYELGYRVQPLKNVSLDVATFYNDYSKLILGALGPVIGGTSSGALGSYTLITAVPTNAGGASSYGLEASAKWNPTSYAELMAGYTLLELKFDQPDPFGFSFAHKAPKQQFNLRSSIQLPYDIEFDTSLYYVGDLVATSATSGVNVPSYYRLDTKLSWKPMENLELSLVGQNLLDPVHPEFAGPLYQADAQIPRSVYGNITWKF